MLIDSTFFVGEISLPNLDKAMQAAKILEAITAYEDEVLERVLGPNLFNSYKTDATTARMVALINGGVAFSFDLSGTTINRTWNGLKVKGKSFIACYVYFHHTANNVTTTTALGEMEAKAELAAKAASKDKMVRALNKASELIGQGNILLRDKLDTYTHSNDAASLFNYLLANKSIYPEWECIPIKKINVFGF
jgi:hypothetical protein